MALIATLFFGFAPMFLFAYILYWLDRYEKEPVILLGAVFAWGMIVAAGGAYVLNTLFGIGAYLLTGSEATADIATGSISAPLVEEGGFIPHCDHLLPAYVPLENYRFYAQTARKVWGNLYG